MTLLVGGCAGASYREMGRLLTACVCSKETGSAAGGKNGVGYQQGMRFSIWAKFKAVMNNSISFGGAVVLGWWW